VIKNHIRGTSAKREKNRKGYGGNEIAKRIPDIIPADISLLHLQTKELTLKMHLSFSVEYNGKIVNITRQKTP
jgi:hypothetical protein